MKKLKIAQFGLGPIGVETLKLAATRPWAGVVGAVDIAPDKVGRDLGQVTGSKSLKGRRVFGSLEEVVAQTRPDLVFHTAVSRFEEAFEHLASMARLGINVVSSCEELVFPQLRHPRLARSLDRVCKAGGARVLGTGVNPGFVMDVLPLLLTSVTRDVCSVHVQRVVNASTRRGPLQKKIGSGQPPEVFGRLLKQGKAGHAGLKESAALIAHCLGWEPVRFIETSQPIVAPYDLRTAFFEVKRGQTCGIHQRVEARVKGVQCLTLDLQMCLDAEDPHDAIQIEGDPTIQVLIPGGVPGDAATAAALVHVVPRLLEAPPGLRLMTDLALPRFG